MKTTRFTRRDFIRSTSVAAAAPFILPSAVWSAETPPNERLTLGFIGIGTQGRGLMGGFLGRKDVQVLAVCDVDTTRRENGKKMVEDAYAKQKADYKGCAAYNDFRELLARQEINAVVIATPDHWHAPIGVAACKAGKDIYCEKPLTQSIHEARALVDAVRKHNRVFQTGSMQRSSKEFRIACELVRNGVIGKVKTVEVAIGGPGVPCDLPEEAAEPGLDWDMWLGPAPKRAYNSILSPRGVHRNFPDWRKYREYGGGMVTDWGAHHFDITQWGLGMDESGPVELFPASKPKASEGVRFKYANGVEVLHKNSGYGVTFIGSEGKVLVNRGKFELWMGDQEKANSSKGVDPALKNGGAMLSAALASAEKEYLTDAKVKLYNSTDHKGDWITAIAKRSKPICDVEVGARSVTVCHLVNLAYYHGQSFKWDPAKNVFADGTGKAEWLDIPHRGEWKV
jgi:predicted dehydrogenase